MARTLMLLTLVVLIFVASNSSFAKSGKKKRDRSKPKQATTYYVSPKGNNDNSGLSRKKAFRSLQHAADVTKPGDTVLALNGTYTEPGVGSTVLFIENSGTPDKWIQYKAYPGHRPIIKVNQHWGGITVDGSAYILIEGFKVEGDVRNVSREYALQEMSNLDNPVTSGSGISIRNGYQDPTRFPHHIIVRGNHVHHCPGGGITTKYADYVTIENNLVHHNTFTAPYAESGISMYLNSNFDNRRAFRMIVRGNISYRNENFVPHFYSNPEDPSQRSITDGNGIIVDDTRNVQSDFAEEPYTGYTLITGNIAHSNGGRGMLVYLSDNVYALFNISLFNARTPGRTADVEVNNSSNILLIWNLIRPRRDRLAVEAFDNTNSIIQRR